MSAPIGTAWTATQEQIMRRQGFRVPRAVLLERLAAAGPPRTASAATGFARRRRISLRARSWRRAPAPRRAAWSAKEDAILRRLVGAATREAIAAELNRDPLALGRNPEVPRTAESVRARANLLGLATGIRGHAREAVLRLMGWWIPEIRHWLRSGVLRPARPSRGRGSGLRVTEAELERFIREAPWRVDWRKMAPGRLRDLARALHLRRPTLSTRDAAGRLGVPSRLIAHWCRHGKLAGAFKADDANGSWRIPAATVRDLMLRKREAA